MDIKSIDTIKTGEVVCEVCGNGFTPKTKKAAIYCSVKCRQAGANEKTRLQNQEKFLTEYGDDPLMPVCKECGWKAFDLITHITKFHKMPMKEYYSKHNCSQLQTFHPKQLEERQERITGEKNPGYQHGGTLSSISRNFKYYVGKTDEEKDLAIKEVQNKQVQGRELSDGYQTRVSYWTTRGHSKEDAILKVQERQRTFSKDKCILKYGEELGLETWNARQKLWMDTLYENMTDEEYADLSYRKTSALRNGWSKIALSLFVHLNHSDAVFATDNDNTEAQIVLPDGTEFAYPVDYMLGNKVIEFYGDTMHANPIKYKPSDFPSILKRQNAQYIWNKDAYKQHVIKEAGYELLIVWEHDFKWNKEETIKRCKDFLGLV